MAEQDDARAARAALRTLFGAAQALARHHGGSVDAQRLLLDLQRVEQDVDLLCGQEAPPVPPRLQVIDDTAYPQDFWMDAEDEGLGGGR